MIDLSKARETFDNSTDLSVGIEEEFAILDPHTLELVSKFEHLSEAAAQDPILAESLAGELISSEIEIRSGYGENFAAALTQQRDRRKRLFALAQREGVMLGATGTHPTSDYRDQKFIDTEHYRKVVEELQYVAYRNNTFSLHVHVGVRGADRAVKVCDRLRPILPLLLAVSANSPFVDGRPAGLHSARSQIFTRNFPRCGIPDTFGSWDEWAKYVSLLERTNSIVEFTQIWWSVRPHHTFGTVEIRICDVQMTAGESEALAELMVACVAQAVREVDAGEVPATVPQRLLEENFWRAIRYGQDGFLLDLEAPEIVEFPASEVVDRLSSWTGVSVNFPEKNGAQRQNTMIAEGMSPREVYAASVRETQATYFESNQ